MGHLCCFSERVGSGPISSHTIQSDNPGLDIYNKLLKWCVLLKKKMFSLRSSVMDSISYFIYIYSMKSFWI